MRQLLLEAREDEGAPDALLPSSLLDKLRTLLGCSAVSMGIIDSTNRSVGPWQDQPVDPGNDDPARLALFFRHYFDCAPCVYPDRTGDIDSVIQTSDFYTARQYRSTGMWSEYFAPAGIGNHMTACLAGARGRTLRLAAFREPGRAFTERERIILWLLRPHLLRLYEQRQEARPEAVPLTERQRQLLSLVADGRTDRQIARELGIAESTVRKHLQNVYAHLNVSSRTAAVVKAFQPVASRAAAQSSLRQLRHGRN